MSIACRTSLRPSFMHHASSSPWARQCVAICFVHCVALLGSSFEQSAPAVAATRPNPKHNLNITAGNLGLDSSLVVSLVKKDRFPDLRQVFLLPIRSVAGL